MTKPNRREQQLQHIAKLYVHVLTLLNIPVLANVKQSAADDWCWSDYSEYLRAELRVLRTKSLHDFDNMIQLEANAVLRAWWEEDCKRHAAQRRQTSNRRNAGRRMGIVSKDMT